MVLGLVAVSVGLNAVIRFMSQSEAPVLFIVSLALGGLIGEWIDIDGRSSRLADHVGGTEMLHGLVTAMLIYCVGALAILGPINLVLYGDSTYLEQCAIINFFTAMVLATTYGYGMALSSVSIIVWYGAIYLAALLLRNSMPEGLVAELNIVGGVLLFCSGLGLLEVRKIKTLNLLPALLFPILYYIVKGLF